MKKIRWFSYLILMAALLLTGTRPAYAQEEEFSIHLRREFGYGAGSNVRGNFSFSLAGDEARVASVAFLIDGEVMALVEEPPFSIRFHTDHYGFGPHYLSAQVTLKDGQVKDIPAVRLNFVTPEEERSSMVLIFGGMGGVLLLALVVYLLIQTLVFKRKPDRKGQPGETRSYGMLGAAICPKCGRPFPRHIWGVNMVVGKFDRCEHCGKWSITTRATPDELKTAEAAELHAQAVDQDENQPNEMLKNALEDSRYTDEL